MVKAVIFDLDGVITDTAELHYQSWSRLAAELDFTFSRSENEALRGVSRMMSLEIFLGPRIGQFSDEQKAALAARKNRYYLELVDRMTPADLLPGIPELLTALNEYHIAMAIASSSRNAGRVVDHLGIRDLFSTVVDGNSVEASKPAPDLFLVAAEQLGFSPKECVVIEDAESGVEAAIAADMRVIGVGPAKRVGRAARFVPTTAELTIETVFAIDN
jgi:beta-phosphoglucomutase